MIIVKTSNGDVFINDKAVIGVSHNREAKRVYVRRAVGIDNTIENVEMVIYANDAQPTNWQDEGSEIQELRKTINRLKEDVDYANALNRFSRQEFGELFLVVERVKSQLKMEEKKTVVGRYKTLPRRG